MITLAVAALLGALTWTLMEYCIHRWMGHDRRFRRSLFGREHVRHHAEGDYFAPTSKKAIVVAIVAVVFGAPAWLVAGAAGLAWTAGLLGLYIGYELLHRREHTHAGIGAYGRWARRHHFHHHFVDPHTNHGVTSPLWDLVFGTYRQPSTIPVPERLCMAWLRDPVTRDIHPRHAATFVLRPSRAR
jgi:sterol desaturase/sphingolipid hydroxylase (fatty acid hydroxylase superfamily)